MHSHKLDKASKQGIIESNFLGNNCVKAYVQILWCPGYKLASSNVTGNGCYFESYRRSDINFFIRCRFVAVQLTVCKHLINISGWEVLLS